jgi:hypothetical protein
MPDPGTILVIPLSWCNAPNFELNFFFLYRSLNSGVTSLSHFFSQKPHLFPKFSSHRIIINPRDFLSCLLHHVGSRIFRCLIERVWESYILVMDYGENRKRINRNPPSSLSWADSPARGPVWPSLPPSSLLLWAGSARPSRSPPLALGRSAGAAQPGAQPSPFPLPALGRLAAHSARPSRLCAWARRARPAGAGGRFLAAASARGTRPEAVENRPLFFSSNPAASVFLSPRAARPSCLAPVQDRRRDDRRGELVPVFPLPFPFFPPLFFPVARGVFQPRSAASIFPCVRAAWRDGARPARLPGSVRRSLPSPYAQRGEPVVARPLRVRPPALGHGGAAPARLPRPPLPSFPASVWLARPGAACPPAALGSPSAACPPQPRLGFARGRGGLPARGRPGPSLARDSAWRRSSPAPSLAWRRSSPAPSSAVAAQLACPQLGVAAQLACPQLGRGGAARLPPSLAWRRSSPVPSSAVAAQLACSPARPRRLELGHGAPPAISDVAAWRAPGRPSSLAAAHAICSWRPRSLARVCGSGPRPRSLTRVVYSPVQRLTITLSHLSFRCELSRYDVLRQLKVLVQIELCQEAAIIRHGLLMLR